MGGLLQGRLQGSPSIENSCLRLVTRRIDIGSLCVGDSLMASDGGLTEPFASWLEDLFLDFRRSSDMFSIGDITCLVGVVSELDSDSFALTPHVFTPGRRFLPGGKLPAW